MTKKVQDLHEFIERAVKSRKYPESTAQGYRAALKLFEEELNEDEKNSIDLFKKNLSQIYQNVSLKNGKTYSAGSLEAYKYRITKIINDYDKYGIDPTKMAGWSPKVVARAPRKKTSSVTTSPEVGESTETGMSPIALVGMHKIELALRPDKKFLIMVPMDITSTESNTIKAILDSLVIKG